MKAGPTVIPTLAARSRQRKLQDLALGRTPTPSQVGFDQPLALLSYLQTSDSSKVTPSSATGVEMADLASQIKAEPSCVVEPEPQPLQLESVKPERPMPSWTELLIWLALLLVDGSLALRDLFSQRRKPVIHPHHSHRKTSQTELTSSQAWLRGDLNPASRA